MKPVMIADLFCGAGGTSTGAVLALAGRPSRITAVNHWPVAIETHQKNHPDARHYCTGLDAARPLDLIPEGRLDLLMASPECTHHSRARGGKPINDQSRASAWHVVRWATELRVRSILVENVPEFEAWGPLCARGLRPLKSRRGEYFRAWVSALEAIGFRVAWRVLNAADYGDATTRKRLFVQARSDGKPIAWPAPTHSQSGTADLFGAGAKRWRAARDVIDWSLPGRSIFGRAKPLSANTLRRIYTGAERFGWPEPFLVVLRQHMDARSLDAPLPTITAGGTHLGLVQPFVLGQQSGSAPRAVTRPLPTIATGGAHALVSGPEAFLVPAFGERAGQSPRVHAIDAPAPTICATGRLNLVQARRQDVTFRMLQPRELADAMGFPAGPSPYQFAGNKTEVTKQIGNAVPGNTACALVRSALGIAS